MSVTRRQFLRGMGAAGAALAARPLLPRLAWAIHSGFDPAPFPHGVASGDLLPDRVLIWTRVEDPMMNHTSVAWKVATSPDMTGVVASGTSPVDPSKDRTVKVDVTGLVPGLKYYYQFEAGTDLSPIGRTNTAPTSTAAIRFALASCQDYQAGYYHVWEHIAARAGTPADLDFVLFLGDYIYEYADDGDAFRPHDPAGEILTLADYRARYRNYRSDPHLREAHRLFPFVCVWDDHEVANDRWGEPDPGGAENHQTGEGDYLAREADAEQAYFEYIPIREEKDPDRPGRNKVYRSFPFGDLGQIIALDTRSYRNRPIGSFLTNPVANLDPAIDDPSRTLLGARQKAWLKERLADPAARWKLVGNQVMIGHLTFGFVPDELSRPVSELLRMLGAPNVHRDGIPVNYDQWDDYQPERREILEWVRSRGKMPDEDPATYRLHSALGHPDRIDDVLFLTGDIHTSWAMQLMVNPGDLQERPAAAELVGPSVTSINLNELLGESAPVGEPLPHRSSAPVEVLAIANNPHMRFVELDSNGYVEIEVARDPAECRATYWHVMNPSDQPLAQPVRNPAAVMGVPPGGRWRVQAGNPTLLPMA